ncbi:AN1-type zinc finger protein 1 isoform X3 [Echeneis naucrates]|uniref:AN1-type zinc finger protein 1 isoform X3 n=1 Tax=Echeneis naucrates TaxID=173247 RepID=UPI001113C34D|nr:AN1-type zinc finger protein 1 isoform X3 [Echeneis naucrates]
MAELDIGKHCQVDSCNLKDFLPFVCDSCCGVFCLEHRNREAHSCPEVGLKKEPRATGGSTSYPCSFDDCKGKELLPVICPQCEKHFCLAHRHQDDHKCEKLEVQKPRMAATKELVQKIVESKDGSKSKGRRGAKNSATAAKVALMKLKLHAAGDKGLPQVYLPKDSKCSSQPMFFCSKWSVGKVVDYAASLASLKNNNNVLTAKKLRLCHPQTGEALRMDDTLLSLLAHPETPLYNGGNVILEYLDNESLCLTDVSDYIRQT